MYYINQTYMKPNMNKELEMEVSKYIKTMSKKKIKFIDVHIPKGATFKSKNYNLIPLERQKACCKEEVEQFATM